MFVAGAQCMCDRSYGEDDAEDDEAEDTGLGQHRNRDLPKPPSSSCAIRGAPRYRAAIATKGHPRDLLSAFSGKRKRSFRAETRTSASASRNGPRLTQTSVNFIERLHLGGELVHQRQPE